MRSSEEINKEVDALEALLPKVKPKSVFGDDNLAAIRAQIRVLREGMNEDGIYGEWDDDRYILENAVFASDWATEDEDQSPSKEWSALVED